ncbi:unnamed protein product [Mesocestoides corti]|uniref:Sodium/hydrogen exchanger n=1 Tax=Mesocestoides corti TaxID=53468 RepID=A0A0R3UM20_MESCO|nr:unnamed protein product [Mesocestoides corti]
MRWRDTSVPRRAREAVVSEVAMNASQEHLEIPRVALASWNFQEVSTFLCLSLFVLLVLLIKYAYHKMKWVAAYIPESLILIVIGLIFGAIVWYIPDFVPHFKNVRLTPTLFFNILLPPIVLEASYSLFNRTFADFFIPIMLFAVVGTVLNFLIIGLGMWGIDVLIGIGGPTIDLSIKEYLLFASLIVAVDPVAVLAIFQDIGVDAGLYYMVFGESLLNDAVTVVLYNIMSAFVAADNIYTGDILIGVGSFFTVSLGGALIGLLHGIFSCLITRLSALSGALPLVLMSYVAYMVGDLFGWSGIISMIVCGVFQAAYAFHNVAPLKVMMLRSAVAQLASICEAIIFLLLGLEVMATNLTWHTGFAVSAVVMCLFARTIVTFVLSACINHNRPAHSKIHWSEQIIISYGGLRGAVAFSLAVLIKAMFLGNHGTQARDVLLTTTLVVILFTVAFMGVTMKPLVRLLNIRLASKSENKLLITLNNSVMDQALVYVETLIGEQGSHRLRKMLYHVDDKYIRPFLQKDAMIHSQKIVKVYEKLALEMHTEAMESRGKLEATGTKEDSMQTSGDARTRSSTVRPRLRRFPTSALEILNDVDDEVDDEIFLPSVRSNMPTCVRRRVNVASMYQGDNSEVYSPHRSIFHQANDAHFAQYSRGQHRLLEAMTGHIHDQSSRSKVTHALSVDSAAADMNSEKRKHGRKYMRHHTEAPGYRGGLSPHHEEEDLLGSGSGGHHFSRGHKSPTSPQTTDV